MGGGKKLIPIQGPYTKGVVYRAKPRTGEQLEEVLWERQRRRAGRFRVGEVINFLSKNTGLHDCAGFIQRAISERQLPLRNPRDYSDFRNYPTNGKLPDIIRAFHDCVDTADVNRWLDSHPEWRVKYRFPVEPPQALPKEPESRLNNTGTDVADAPPGIKSVIAWRVAVEKQLDKLMVAHGGIYPGHKVALRWFKSHDAEAAFVPDDKDDEFTWVKADGKRVTSALKTFQNGMADILKSKKIPN